ncbi:hypothetical protein K2P97_02645 [bacterium]|nr:hypothetical protein [bacterium]
MAKTKPTPKATKNKAKPAKPAKVVKKDDKKAVKKPVVQAKAKPAKAVAAAPAKKVDPKKEKEAAKVAASGSKNNAKAKAVVTEIPVAKAQQKPTKADSKIKTKAKKTDKKADDDMEDDLIGDDFGESEIAEYEEDLKAVEDDEDDTDVELSEDDEDDKKDEEVYLTDSEGRRLCKVRDCDQVATVDTYCRYHYLLLWKKIQIRKSILNDGKLEKYLEDLTSRYPDKFLEVIKKDLKSEKDFLSVIQEMELDENALNEIENEDEVQSFADEIRGIGEAPSMDEDGDF